MRHIFIILGVLSLCNAALSMNIERVEFLGSNFEGSRIAVFRSHFGASSDAPFSSIQILEVNKSKPLFEKGLSAFQGDENTVEEMRKRLISDASPMFLKFEISTDIKYLSVDSLVSEFDNQVLIEADTRRKDRELQRFNLLTSEDKNLNCPSGRSIKATLSKLNLPVENFEISRKRNSCWDRKWKYSKAILIGQYIWLQFFIVSEPMPELFFASQEFFAIRK